MAHTPYATAVQAFAPLFRIAANRGEPGDYKAVNDLKRQCYNTLTPHVVKLGPTAGSLGDGTISFGEFSASAEPLIMPLLRRTNPDVQPQTFRTLWGQVNRHAIPALAKLAGIHGFWCDTTNKRTNICIGQPPVPQPPMQPAAAGASTSCAGAASTSTPSGVLPASPARPGARWCVYCGSSEHLMMGCAAFQQMLREVYAAGAASATSQRHPTQPAASTATQAAPANDWNSLAQRAMASVQQAGSGYQAAVPAAQAAQLSTATETAAPPQGAPADGAPDDLCLICRTEFCSQMFIPCGHYVVCIDCGARMMNRAEGAPAATCPLCQAEVDVII